jgi:CHAT domain-containing protein
MNKIILLLLVLFSGTLYAQETNLNAIFDADAEGNSELVLELLSGLNKKELADSNLIQVVGLEGLHAQFLEQFERSEKAYKELIQLLKKPSEAKVQAILDLAYLYQIMGENEQVLQQYELASSMSKEEDLPNAYVKTEIEKGLYYEYLGALDYAVKHYKNGLNKIKEAKIDDPLLKINNLHQLARVLEIQHHYDEAESLYKEAFALAEKEMSPEEEAFTSLLNDYGMLYFFKEQYKKAIPFFERINQLVEEKILPVEAVSTTLCNLADCYAHLGEYAEAEKLYTDMMKIDLEAYGESYYNYPVTVSRLGDLYGFQGEDKRAEKMHLKAIALAKEYIEPQYVDRFYIMEQAYLFFQKQENWEKVKNIALESFKVNSLDPFEWSTDSLQVLQTMAKEHSFSNLPYALKALQILTKAEWETYQANQELPQLEKAYELQKATQYLLERLKNSFSTEMDKLELLRKTVEIANLGVQISQKLWLKTQKAEYQTSLFHYMELNKYTLLQDALKAKEAKHFGGLPQDIIVKEEQLAAALSIAKSQKVQTLGTDAEANAVQAFNTALSNYNELQQKLKKDYPQYYEYRYMSEAPNIAALKQQLQENQLLLEFLVTPEQIYTFLICSHDYSLFVQPIAYEQLREKVSALRNLLTDYSGIEAQTKNSLAYQELAYWFYQKLIAPALEMHPETQKLIIVPDGILGHLPFETFISEAPQASKSFAELPYLLNKYDIQYSYAAKLLLQKSKGKKAKKGILALAADYGIGEEAISRTGAVRTGELRSLRKHLQPLPAAEKEVKLLEDNFDGQFLYGEKANEANFKKQAKQFAVLHLAMHGLLNEKHPILSSLAFTENGNLDEDNFLQAYEISEMQLNADLVVLSACETGYGKLAEGEGVLSLARSFMYAGAPALVVSLWQVNDASTGMIMQKFYQHLKAGEDKASALRKAKVDFIAAAKESNPMAAHPAFWAAFIQLGDDSPINIQPKQQWGQLIYWGIGLVALLLLLAGFRWRQKQKITE